MEEKILKAIELGIENADSLSERQLDKAIANAEKKQTVSEFKIDWVESVAAVPITFRLEGVTVALGAAEDFKLNDGVTVAYAIKTQDQLEKVFEANPKFKRYVKGNSSEGWALIEERLKQKKEA